MSLKKIRLKLFYELRVVMCFISGYYVFFIVCELIRKHSCQN
ncbi:hypothetical protein TASCI_10268 [Tenacibaculum ascidiaceicola]